MEGRPLLRSGFLVSLSRSCVTCFCHNVGMAGDVQVISFMFGFVLFLFCFLSIYSRCYCLRARGWETPLKGLHSFNPPLTMYSFAFYKKNKQTNNKMSKTANCGSSFVLLFL